MQNALNYSLPLVAAFIGWGTNYLAVKMLFHPRRAWRVFGITIQGIFPKRQRVFAEKLGHLVADELFSIKEISAHLSQKAVAPDKIQLITERIEDLMMQRVPQLIPMASIFLRGDHIHRIIDALKGDLNSMIGELVSRISYELENELDVKKIVESKVANFSSEKLEEVLFSIMRREFKFIEISGGVLGLLVGLLQLLIAQLI